MDLLFYLLLCVAAAGDEQWKTRTSEHFKLYYMPASERRADALLPRLETELARVGRLLEVEPGATISVVYAPDRESFLARQGGGAPSWASGMAYPAKSLIYLRPLTGLEVRHNSLRAIMAHEISHVLLHRKLKGRHAPVWLDEGLAVFMSAEPLHARAERLVTIGITGRYISFRKLEYGFPRDGETAAIAYAQSGDFIRFLYSHHGDSDMRRYLELLAAGEDPDKAMKAAFGATLFDLETEWLKRVRRAYGIIPTLSGGAMLWFLISLLAIAAYLKKRAGSRKKLALMALEDEYIYGNDDDEEEYYDDDDEPPFRGLH